MTPSQTFLPACFPSGHVQLLLSGSFSIPVNAAGERGPGYSYTLSRDRTTTGSVLRGGNRRQNPVRNSPDLLKALAGSAEGAREHQNLSCAAPVHVARHTEELSRERGKISQGRGYE